MRSATIGPFITRDGGERGLGSARLSVRRRLCGDLSGWRRTATTSLISPASILTGSAPTALIGHKAYISVGHDEYWSGEQRANVEAARDAGVNLLFWSGNEVYWKTRYEASIDGTDTAYRTLVCYKETWANGNSERRSGGLRQYRPVERMDRHLARLALRRR